MPEEPGERKDVHAVLIAVGRIGMPERVGRQTVLPAEVFFVFRDEIADELGIDRPADIRLLCEQPVPCLKMRLKGMPVAAQELVGIFCKDDKTIPAVLARRNIYLPLPMVDIGTFQAADFMDPQPGRIHQGDHGFFLDIFDGRDKFLHGLTVRNERDGMCCFSVRDLFGFHACPRTDS